MKPKTEAPNFVWLVSCACMLSHYQRRGSSDHLCFRAEKEAIEYCACHTSELEFWSWQKIEVRKLKTPRKKK